MGLFETRLRLCANFQVFFTPRVGRTSRASRFAGLPIPQPLQHSQHLDATTSRMGHSLPRIGSRRRSAPSKISSLAASFARLLHSKSARPFWLWSTTLLNSAVAAKQAKQVGVPLPNVDVLMEPMLQLAKDVSTPRPCHVPERIGTAPATSLLVKRRTSYQ